MASSSSNEPKCGNPYTVLGLSFPCTSAQIKKAFRSLSLKLHPDKRASNLTDAQTQALDKQFIQVQEAKSFLLDVENANKRKKYDSELESLNMRKEDNERRKKEMSESRRNMMNDLERKEQELRAEKARKQQFHQQPSYGRSNQTSKNETMENLKKRGKRMREEYNDREATMQRQQRSTLNKKRKAELRHKQVRLKWSRSKLGYQSKLDIINLLSPRFGPIEDVELIGSKGNAALVTFEQFSSCQPCVDAYADSKEMRATLEEIDTGFGGDDNAAMFVDTQRESMEERKLRQAAEREKILRQMEEDEDNTGVDPSSSSTKTAKGREKDPVRSSHKVSSFPPKLPPCDGGTLGAKVSYLERLEEMETKILKTYLSPDALQGMQITR